MFDSLRKPLRMFIPTVGERTKSVPSVYSTAQPGLMVILIDQSQSMEWPWPNRVTSKAEEAAGQVNALIEKVILQSMVGNAHRERLYLAAYGYSDLGSAERSFRRLVEGWPADLASSPAAVNSDWIRMRAEGRTPMSVAFDFVTVALEQFFSYPDLRARFENSAPVVVINITDGKADELSGRRGALKESVERLKAFPSPQGFCPLVFHVQIADGVDQVFCPRSSKGLDKFGTLLFQLASKIPDSWIGAQVRRNSEGNTKDDTPLIEEGSVGLVVGGGPALLMNLLDFASRPSNGQ